MSYEILDPITGKPEKYVMKFQFDGYKHAIGYAAVAATPIASAALLDSHLAHARVLAAAAAATCGLIAFLCGAQSKAAFVTELARDAGTAGVKVPDVVVEEVVAEVSKDEKAS